MYLRQVSYHLLAFSYDGNSIGSFKPHMTERHAHRKAISFSNAGILYVDVGRWAKLSDGGTITQDLYTDAFGGHETAGAWLAVSGYISY